MTNIAVIVALVAIVALLCVSGKDLTSFGRTMVAIIILGLVFALHPGAIPQ